MAVYSDNLLDERTGRPIEAAELYVYTSAGALAVLTDALDQPLTQPLVTDANGAFEYKVADSVYRHDFWKNSVLIYRDNRVIVGTPGTISVAVGTFGQNLVANATAADARADLGVSASSEFIDFAAPVSVNSGGAHPATDLNKLVICGNNASAYTRNLPPVTGADVGKAVKVEIDRQCLVVVTIQSAPSSGLFVDGQSDRKMIAGESALFVYRGPTAGWTRHDYTAVPICAEMWNSGATALAVGTFTDIPMPAAGIQLMDQDLKAIWGFSGGYFTAPRTSVYNIKGYFWLSQTGAPGQIDVGCYVAASGGGSPTSQNFTRTTITNSTFQKVEIDLSFRMNAGEKLFPCIQLQSPISASSVVDSATVMSKISITESPR